MIRRRPASRASGSSAREDQAGPKSSSAAPGPRPRPRTRPVRRPGRGDARDGPAGRAAARPRSGGCGVGTTTSRSGRSLGRREERRAGGAWVGGGHRGLPGAVGRGRGGGGPAHGALRREQDLAGQQQVGVGADDVGVRAPPGLRRLPRPRRRSGGRPSWSSSRPGGDVPEAVAAHDDVARRSSGPAGQSGTRRRAAAPARSRASPARPVGRGGRSGGRERRPGPVSGCAAEQRAGDAEPEPEQRGRRSGGHRPAGRPAGAVARRRRAARGARWRR